MVHNISPTVPRFPENFLPEMGPQLPGTISQLPFYIGGLRSCEGASKNRGGKPTKMDGENNGKPYEQMADLGVPLFLETPI